MLCSFLLNAFGIVVFTKSHGRLHCLCDHDPIPGNTTLVQVDGDQHLIAIASIRIHTGIARLPRGAASRRGAMNPCATEETEEHRWMTSRRRAPGPMRGTRASGTRCGRATP